MTIRFAKLTDAPAILAIYAPYVEDSVITFEYVAPTISELSERIRTIQEQYPYLVAEIDGQVLGYAYASRHRDRTAYQWSVDTSVYVHPDGQRKGMARQLYTTLFDLLRQQGYYNAYAGITMPNPKSEALHQSFGFEPIGTYSNVGYKMGAWHDVTWFKLNLQPHQLNPTAPVPISQLSKLHL
ncbi:arsinothricin resistance N-acetyltransferase ArsN1 family B [Spirosoma agri]|uniref:N-acetyltransferase n=1 Tax=Spirosoma agri TaxID=1987381 RepID=A0A6M0IF12_9BACT|nr:arsinothricin resistance N-acetyltransferase ArsN1 family B [Spirosoma agri]NEU66738.1 N-acetyltransferase [Spirosoma agri]